MRQRLINGLLGPALVVAVALGVWGCGKKAAQEGAPQPAPAAANNAPAAQPPPPQQGQPAQATTQANSQPDLAEVNRTLIRWVVRNKRRPATFDEFAATAGAPIPPPPAGMKYVIGPKVKIELVNQ